MSARDLSRGLLFSKPKAGSGPSLLQDVAIKGFCKQCGGQSHHCSAAVSHPPAAPGKEQGPEMVTELEQMGYSDLTECNDNFKK